MSGPRRFSPLFFALVASLVTTSQQAATDAHAAPLPPLVIFDESSATGHIIRGPHQSIGLWTFAIRESLTVQNVGLPPRDTIPARSTLMFSWHSEPVTPGNPAVAYQYKLDEPNFITVDPSITSVGYDLTAPEFSSPGMKVFTLRVQGNRGDPREITRRFWVGFAPETWFAGPDTTTLDARFGWTSHERHLDIADWHALPDLSGTLLSCDSLTQLPAERAAHKTFFEIYGNRLFVRTENDTVHMNSWIVAHGGGLDLDSPYLVNVASDPALVDTETCVAAGVPYVIRPDGLNASPIGFRFSSGELLDPGVMFQAAAQSGLFPLFDEFSPFRNPVIAGYAPFSQSGKVYLVMRAEDGDGGQDRRIPNTNAARMIADHVDGGTGTPEEIALRSRILTFYVNQSPFLRLDQPAFVPHPGMVFPTRTLNLNLLADDSDPYDLENRPPNYGGPSSGPPVLRWTVTVRGRNDGDRDTTYLPPGGFRRNTPNLVVSLPDWITSQDITVEVELCDCADCELQEGTGRCVTYSIPVQVPPMSTATQVSLIGADASPELVRVRWHFGAGAMGPVRVERRSPESEWREVGVTLADGTGQATYEDRAVEAGARLAYRLVFSIDGRQQRAGEVWVDVPRAAEFALEGVRPNPAVGDDFTVHFSLAKSDRARLEMLDLSGRRVFAREVGALGPGRHAIRLGAGARLAPGVYILRLVDGREVRVARAALVR